MIVITAALALMAFAANSLLCRLALRDAAIDPATFSTIRLVAGAAMLSLVVARRGGRGSPRAGSWTSAAALALYAVPFAFAYTGLTAGTGALLLFGAVQLTMLGAAVRSGERPSTPEWIGLLLAFGGLVYLVLPGLAAPPLGAALLMSVAGIAWGVYSLRGRRERDPLGATAANFLRGVPLVLAVSAATLARFEISPRGALLAAASGALASGLGYVAWYAALRGLTTLRAAILQLAVPVIAGAGGVLLLGEAVSLRLVLSAVVVLGGIALVLLAREKRILPA